MADDMVVLQCEKCSTRLKVRAVTAKIMKEVKCPKCGAKVLTKNVVAPVEGAAPAPAPAPAAPEPKPEVAPVAAPAPVVAPPPQNVVIPEAIKPVAPPPPVAPPVAPPAPAPAPAPMVTPAPVVAPPPSADAEELKQARARITALEQQVQALTARLASMPAVAPVTEELVKARQIIAEQEERLSHFQQMWFDKEKEARSAHATAQRAQQDRKFALDQMEAVLKGYHQMEVEAATERINNLNARLQQFLTQQATQRPPA